MIKRILDISGAADETAFLWGPRQTGKSTLLKDRFPEARLYDLLLSDVYRRLVSRPALLREEIAAGAASRGTPVIIDEVQKIPELLDEVHWLIENRGVRFILCGSSARKLVRGHANLLGGRAIRYELQPLVYSEIPDFSLNHALTYGLLPRHYLCSDPAARLDAYVGDYLRQEIATEALTRNLSAFSRFLEISGLSNGEMVNYQNIARECAVSAPTVAAYFGILEDTLMGCFLPAFRKRKKRRLIQAPRFYFFDVGVVGCLTRRGRLEPGSELFGRAMEHFIYMEIVAYARYSRKRFDLAYWRTASQIEVDFVLGDAETAVEVKANTLVQTHHLRGLRAFKEEHTSRHYLAVTLDPVPRVTEDGIEILPWRVFLERLWGGDLV